MVVDPGDVEKFLAYAAEENLEAVTVAVVTEEPRLVLNWRGKTIVDISRASVSYTHLDTSAFSIYTSATDRVDTVSAGQAVASVLRFLTRMGILRYTSHSGYIASVIRESDMTDVLADKPGIYCRPFEPGQEVRRGDALASVIDPAVGEEISRILSPTDGMVFFAHSAPLVMEGTVVYKIIRRLHQ